MDGQTATNSSNTLSNVLPGLTLNLQSASVGTTVQVGVSLNTSSIASSLNNFVSAYKPLNSTIQSLQAYGGVGGTNGALFGDPGLQFAERPNSNYYLIRCQFRYGRVQLFSHAEG